LARRRAIAAPSGDCGYGRRDRGVVIMLLIAQLAASNASTSSAQSDQDRVTASEVFDYAEWRTCALKETHRKAHASADHEKVADLAMAACEARESAYRGSLTTLAQLYKVADPADFTRRNGDQARAALRAMMLKELK
jgi:hypothetical protein